MSVHITPNRLPFFFSQAGAIALNTEIFSWDTESLTSPSLAVQITSLAAGAQFSVEASSDDVVYSVVRGEVPSSGGTAGGLNSVGLYIFPVAARFVRMRVIAAGTTGTTSVSVTPSKWIAVTGAAASGTANVAIIGTPPHQGQSAHDAAISGNPVRSGGRAVTANYTAVANNDAADFITTTQGVQITRLNSIPEADWQYGSPGGIVNTTPVVVKTAVAGLRNYITGAQLRNASATGTEVVILDASTVIWRTNLVSGGSAEANVVFATPLRCSVNTAVNVSCGTAGALVYANFQGYVGA